MLLRKVGKKWGRQSAALVLTGVALMLTAGGTPEVQARAHRVTQVPNNMWSCQLCHTADFAIRTAFGDSVNDTLAGDDVDWAAVCVIDSDGDGASNGAELGDPDCQWQIGDADPAGEVTDPNDPASAPAVEPPAGGAEPPVGGEEPPAGGGEPPAGGAPGGGDSPSPDAGVGGGEAGEDSDEGGCQQRVGATHLWLLFYLSVAYYIRRRTAFSQG